MKKSLKNGISFFLVIMHLSLPSFGAAPGATAQIGTHPVSIVNTMTKPELQGALANLRGGMALLKEDLEVAEKLDDGRNSVKIRNWSFTVSGAAIFALIMTGSVNGASAYLKKSGPYIIFNSEKIFAISMVVGFAAAFLTAAGIVVGAISGAVVILSPEESDRVLAKIQQMETKIAAIEAKLR